MAKGVSQQRGGGGGALASSKVEQRKRAAELKKEMNAKHAKEVKARKEAKLLGLNAPKEQPKDDLPDITKEDWVVYELYPNPNNGAQRAIFHKGKANGLEVLEMKPEDLNPDEVRICLCMVPVPDKGIKVSGARNIFGSNIRTRRFMVKTDGFGRFFVQKMQHNSEGRIYVPIRELTRISEPPEELLHFAQNPF